MATPNDIRTEFETIANAQVGITTFKYGYPADKNTFLSAQYPILMLHKIRDGVPVTRPGGKKTYNIVFGVYDSYLQAEKSTTDYDNKQGEVEELATHFLFKFDERSTDTDNSREWYRQTGDSEVITNEWIENMGDAKLAAYEITFELIVPDDCTLGTFNF